MQLNHHPDARPPMLQLDDNDQVSNVPQLLT